MNDTGIIERSDTGQPVRLQLDRWLDQTGVPATNLQRQILTLEIEILLERHGHARAIAAIEESHARAMAVLDKLAEPAR